MVSPRFYASSKGRGMSDATIGLTLEGLSAQYIRWLSFLLMFGSRPTIKVRLRQEQDEVIEGRLTLDAIRRYWPSFSFRGNWPGISTWTIRGSLSFDKLEGSPYVPPRNILFHYDTDLGRVTTRIP